MNTNPEMMLLTDFGRMHGLSKQRIFVLYSKNRIQGRIEVVQRTSRCRNIWVSVDATIAPAPPRVRQTKPPKPLNHYTKMSKQIKGISNIRMLVRQAMMYELLPNTSEIQAMSEQAAKEICADTPRNLLLLYCRIACLSHMLADLCEQLQPNVADAWLSDSEVSSVIPGYSFQVDPENPKSVTLVIS
jgi:hypothetical protein